MRRMTVMLVAAFAMLGVASGALAQSKCASAKLKAAAKKTQCKTGILAKSAGKNLAPDPLKVSGCETKFNDAFTKAESKGGCIAPNGDAGAIEAKVDAFVDDVNEEEGGFGSSTPNPLPSKCVSAKIKNAGNKAKCKLGVLATAAAKALPPDSGKLATCESKFSAAFTKAESAGDCGAATGDTTTIENKVDAFVDDVNGELTTPPPSTLAFTTTAGTTSCGNAGLTVPASAPTSGNIFSDTVCSSNIAALGLGCLYFGGGNATIVAGGAIPDGAVSRLHISGSSLVGLNTGDRDTCTVGAGPGKECLNNNSVPACTGDGDCGGAAGSCGPHANCYFGPPLPIASPPPFGSLTTCVLNAIIMDASGTFNGGTGDSTLNLPLSSRVYISGNTASPCPKCLSNHCDPSWKTNTATTSPDTNAACTPVGSLLTTNDCRPALTGFQAPLPVNLNPLTTGSASKTDASGAFCPAQTNNGAFGQPGTRCIKETGSPAGDLSDMAPHNSHLASVFCIPATGNAAVDGVADLPGPGAFSLNGNAQLEP